MSTRDVKEWLLEKFVAIVWPIFDLMILTVEFFISLPGKIWRMLG